MLIATALAEPFIVLDGPRPEEQLDWLLAARLEGCLERQAGTIVISVQPSGEVTAVRRAHGTDYEKRCLELEVSSWNLEARNDDIPTRYLLRIQPPQTVKGLTDAATLEMSGRLIGYVAFGEVKIQGPVDRKQVPEVLRQSRKRLRYCYERAGQEPPYLEGRLTVRLAVDGAGKVTTLREVENVLVEPKVATCVNDRFMGMEFPRKGSSQREATITVPVQFVPGI